MITKRKTKKGRLYLIPTFIGEESKKQISILLKNLINDTNYYIVEKEKNARRFIKYICPEKNQNSIFFYILNKHSESYLNTFLTPCLKGLNIGLMSDAGCPAIADPGSIIVKLAHEKKIKVVPIIGPSSILLAMMSSGFNGQNFAFNGYLPINKNELKIKLKKLETKSQLENQTQIFIETPYRNTKLFKSMMEILNPNTELCIASNLSMENEFILTCSIKKWKNKKGMDLNKKPAIFLIHKMLSI